MHSFSWRALLVPAAFLGITLTTASARADMPSSDDDDCTVKDQCASTGVECPYARNNPDAGESDCVKGAKAKGLVVLCSRGGGTVGNDVYCPAGTSRSSGCLVSTERPNVTSNVVPFSLAAGLALAVIGIRRRRRKPASR